jgi:type I restriction enzyme S subunit
MALGKAVFFTRDVAINQDLKALFPAKELAKQYLFHWLQHNAEVIERLGSGSTVKGIRLEVLKGLDFLLPPLSEQRKIAEILSTVDEKMAVIDEQLAQTQELKKGLMQRLLTKGIGHTTFKDSPLGEIPESWEVVRGENISSLISKGASPGWQGFDYTDEGLLFVTSENVKEGRLDISKPKFLPVGFNKKVAKSQLKNGDILINIVGASIGRACIYESQYEFANVNQAVCVLRSNSNVLNSFLLHSLQSPETIKRLLVTQAGSARQNLSLSDIRAFMVILPPLPEQRQIAEILTTVDDKLQVLTDKKAQYQELKRGLMQQLLTGQLRVQVAQPEEALA